MNSLVLPQTGINANLPLAGEYGSSSKGTLQLSGGGQYLTFAEYGINAVTYNAASQTTYGTSVNPPALAQQVDCAGYAHHSHLLGHAEDGRHDAKSAYR